MLLIQWKSPTDSRQKKIQIYRALPRRFEKGVRNAAAGRPFFHFDTGTINRFALRSGISSRPMCMCVPLAARFTLLRLMARAKRAPTPPPIRNSITHTMASTELRFDLFFSFVANGSEYLNSNFHIFQLMRRATVHN